MKKLIALFLTVLVCIGLFSCMPNLNKFAIKFADPKINASPEDLSDAGYLDFLQKLDAFSSRLSSDMYKKYGSNQNFCISPTSVYMSLVVACESSSGETRDEILSALGMTYEEICGFTKYLYASRNRDFKYVSSSGKESISASEQLASSIWLNQGREHRPAGVNRLTSVFHSDVYSVPFNKDGRNIINQYIEYKSKGIISSDISLDRAAVFSIVSVYVLQEIWSDMGKGLPITFNTYNFINADGSETETRLLRGHYSNGSIHSTEQYSTFFIDTEHGYKLHFVVPGEETSLKDVFNEKTISEITSRKDYGHIDEERGEIHFTRILFPEFSTSFSADISSLLAEKYGIESLFDSERCDLSGLLTEDAYCNELIHKAKLNVTSSGIDYEVVYVDSTTPSSPDLPEYEEVYHEMIIDRAFGFVLTDESGTILYSGAINNLD